MLLLESAAVQDKSRDGWVLRPAELERDAQAITTSIALRRGDTVVVSGAPAHRELMVAVAAAAYRGGAQAVDAIIADPLVMRERLEHGRDAALGALTPWHRRRLRELMPTDAWATKVYRSQCLTRNHATRTPH